MSWLAILCAAMTLACATAPPRHFIAPGTDLTGRPSVAFIPFENLAEKPEAGNVVINIFYAELARSGLFDLVEMGEVDAALRELRVRKTGSLSKEQMQQLAQELGADHLMVGTILEAGATSTPEGSVPSLGVTLRLLDGTDGRVVWATVHVRTGEDTEKIFGWGRENDFEQLVLETAVETFEQLRATIAASASRTRDKG
jgi:TolB-like protein